MGRGATDRERPRRRIPCLECGVKLTAGSMTAHRRQMHGTEPETDWNLLSFSQRVNITQVFGVSFPKGTYQFQCPFLICMGYSQTCNGMRNDFNCLHWGGSLQILEEKSTSFPKYKSCGSQVPPWRHGKQNYESDKRRIGGGCRSIGKTMHHCFKAIRV